MKRTLLLFALMLLYMCNVFCQDQLFAKDEARLAAMPEDTVKVNRLNEFAARVQFSDPVKAINQLGLAMRIAQKIRYPLGLSIAYSQRAGLYFYEMKLDSSQELLNKAFDLVKKDDDRLYRLQQANILNMFAALDQRSQNYSTAVGKYLQASAIFRELGDNNKIINSYYNLSGIYKFLGDTAKTFIYAREANNLAIKTDDAVLRIRGMIVLAEAYNFVKQYDSLLLVSKKGLRLATEENLAFAMGIFNNMLGTYYTNSALAYDSAVGYYNTALKIFTQINTQFDIALVLQNLGHVYVQKKDYPNAVKYAGKAAALSEQLSFDQVLYLSLLDLVKAEEAMGNTAESYRYLKRYVAVSESIQSRNSQKKVFDLETKYANQQKEIIFNAQQRIIRGKNLLNYLLAASLLLLIFVVALLYKNYRHKQRLQVQRIADLEMQERLTATEAVLKGEEQERTRIAKDLHDGLGGMLSGVKYSLGKLKDMLPAATASHQAMDRNMDMLDSSIEEMRRLAHNMMPETLVKFGLDTALKDFCNHVNQSGALQVSYQSFSMDDLQLEQTKAASLYRIVQELINNTMKHAAASTAVVQVVKMNNHLSITVEDDGKGFELETIKQAKGIGWTNIQNRVEFLKGSLDVQSTPGKGTSVHLEVPV